jgi:outer membrane protein, heavy metal efflux system
VAISLRAIRPALCLFFIFIPAYPGERNPAGPRAASGWVPGEEAPVPPTDPGRAVSLERVVRIARETAPAIAAARARVLQAEGRSLATRVLPDPELVAGAGHGEPREGGEGAAESSFEISQFFPAPWGLRDRGRTGTALIGAAQGEVETVTAQVVLEAKLLYYQAAIGQSQAQALAQTAADASALRDLVARRVEVGEAPEGDRLRTRVEALRADLEARDATARAAGARAALNRFLIGALGSDFSVSTDLDPRRIPVAPGNLVEVAVAANPAYRTARSRVEAAQWSVSAERAARLPGLGLSMFRQTELDRVGTGVTLGISIPLWNRNKASVAVSEAELAEAEAESLNVRTQIEAEVERLVSRDRNAREVAVAYRVEVLPIALESLSIAQFSVEQGEASLFAWLEARRSYLEVLKASYEAQLEAFQSRAELERLTGEFDDSDKQ